MHKFLLRLPDEVWTQLRKCAKENERSVNGEIVWRLRRSFTAYTK